MRKIDIIPLFPLLTAELMTLLERLNPDDWEKPSPIADRTVKDLVAHMIDGSLRRLSMQRDRYVDPKLKPEKDTYKGLVDFIQLLNSSWMSAASRLSPRILIDLVEYAEKAFFDFVKTLDPDGEAFSAVAWAGETESKNWFDIAREYTEKWHHQMQIRMALDDPLLLDQHFLEPLYDTFMLGVPHLFREINYYPDDAAVKVNLTGVLEKTWILRKNGNGWHFAGDDEDKIAASVAIPADVAWIIWTNTDRNKNIYFRQFEISGDEKPGLLLRDYVTVMS